MARPVAVRPGPRPQQKQWSVSGVLVSAGAFIIAVAAVAAAAVSARPTPVGRVVPPGAPVAGVGATHSRPPSSVSDLPALSRVTTKAVSACNPSRAVATATCPCYYRWMTVAGTRDTAFDITLSLAEVQPRRLSTSLAASAAAALRKGSSYGVVGSINGGGADGAERYIMSSSAVRIDMDVAVTLSVVSRRRTGTSSPGGEGGCHGMVYYVLEPIEARCAMRNIDVGGKGETLDGEFGAAADHPGARKGVRGTRRILKGREEAATGRGRRLTWIAGNSGRGVGGTSRRDSGRSGAANKASSFLPPPTSRIVGGTPIREPAARHFVVRIATSDGMCTGSLISPRHVLTAAHCDVTVSDKVSWPSRESGLPPATTRNVTAVTVHPQWEAARLVHDLAILTLDKDAPAWDSGIDRDDDASAPPLVVAHDASLPADGSGVRAAGYGRTSLDWVSSPRGLSVDLRTVAVPDCKADWLAAPPEGNGSGGGDDGGGEVGSPDARQNLAAALHPAVHVCAGVVAGGCDTCHGDSGGPLYQRVPATDTAKPYYVLVGVTSFSPGCASPNTPTAYTRVASYAGWVDMVVGGDGTGPLRADGSRIGGPSDTATYPMGPNVDPSRREGAGGGGTGNGAALWGSLAAVAVAAVVGAAGILLVRQRRRRRAAAAAEAASGTDGGGGREGVDARGGLPAVAWEPPVVAAAGTPPPPGASATVAAWGNPSPPPGGEGTPGELPTAEGR